MTDRYSTEGISEGEYQPNSDNKVLKNKLNIVDIDKMDEIELDNLIDLQHQLFDELESDQILTIDDLCAWHKRWLDSIYEWAGLYRSVNMSKDGFPFAAAGLIPKLMADFDRKFLCRFTPCNNLSKADLINALALCHVEFILIHPFREGNGRLARLLATVMALQANMPPLDFEIMELQKDRYIAAIHAGHAGDFQPMEIIFSEILECSLQQTFLIESRDSV